MTNSILEASALEYKANTDDEFDSVQCRRRVPETRHSSETRIVGTAADCVVRAKTEGSEAVCAFPRFGESPARLSPKSTRQILGQVRRPSSTPSEFCLDDAIDCHMRSPCA